MLSTNKLKIIAVVCMIIDHIGYFFSYKMDYNLYLTFRCIGRIAMPIFVFSIVQGFKHTRNLKKYIVRLFAIAVITESVIYFLKYFSSIYNLNDLVTNIKHLNIVFSFVLTLIILRVINRQVINNTILDKIIRISILVAILAIYIFVPIDYSFYVPILAVVIYILEFLKEKKSLDKYIYIFILTFVIAIIGVISVNNTIRSICIFICNIYVTI